jgi:hypothetical protein
MIYTGYVVQNETGSATVKVWCPYRDGVALFKKHKGFGGNTGNLKTADLNKLISAASDCYMTSDFVSGNEYLYDPTTDSSTTQENIPDMNENTMYDISSARPDQITNQYSSPGYNFRSRSVFTNPAANFVQSYHIATAEGTEINTYDNTPKGNFVHLTVGTRVLVCFPDKRNIGFIIRQIPIPDSWSKMLLNVTGEN